MIKYLFLSIMFLGINFIYSCTPAGVLASGGATTMVVAEGDRSIGSVVDDATIKINISRRFLDSTDGLFININTNIIGGRVLLTGIVDSQEIRIDAVRRVWEVNGVNEVINEVEVGEKTTLKNYANDLWINTQVKSLAAKTIGIRALSYNFETIKGKVYVAGITSKPDQLDAIIKTTKTIKGVKEIVNYVIVVD